MLTARTDLSRASRGGRALASIARIDAVVGVGSCSRRFRPLVVAAPECQGAGVRLVSLLPWALFMGGGHWYFGQWDPNTAAAQRISVDARLAASRRRPAPSSSTRSPGCGRSAPACTYFSWRGCPSSLSRRPVRWGNRAVLILAGVLACVAQYVLFGAVRLDIARTVTELALYATIAVPFVLLAREEFHARDLIAGACMVAVSAGIAMARQPDRSEIGWGTAWFDVNADGSKPSRGRTNPRPLIANADLGAISWRKKVNVADLGLLGSSIMPRLDRPSNTCSGGTARS